MKPIARVFVADVAAIGSGPVAAVAGRIGGPGPARGFVAPPCDVSGDLENSSLSSRDRPPTRHVNSRGC